MSTEDVAGVIGVIVFVVLAVALFGGLSYGFFRRWRERSIVLTIPVAFRDIWGEKVVVDRGDRPYLYWSLFGFYAALLLCIAVSMIVPLLSLPLLFGKTD